MTVWIEPENCRGCKLCIKACPYDAIEIVDGVAVLNERCTGCGACLEVCKDGCIKSDIKDEVVDLSGYSGVWVFAEQRNGVLNPAVLELLGCASGLAKNLKEELFAVLLGDASQKLEKIVKELIAYGAEKVYVAEDKNLKEYTTTPYAKTIIGLIKENSPSILLLSATHIGRDLAPRISRNLEVGLTADCTELTIDKETKHMLQTRPAFGGNVMATIISPKTRPQLATVRPGVMTALKPNKKRKGKIIKITPKISKKDLMTKLREFVREPHGQVNLQDARVIVAGGRGLGSDKGFKQLQELAAVIGGEVAGTRVVVENGWLTPDRQIGQTGQIVRPELYIACGISGAIQHKAGMQDSRVVIAINKDPDAPIFEIADYSIVGDLHEIVPALTKALRQNVGSDQGVAE
ncbi:FAD-binding protein [[Eubacterium] cellulosolvens]